jgi:hypothetical protein
MNTAIPIPNQLVKYKNGTYRILCINMGGKCKIKQVTTTRKRRFGRVLVEVDINDLTPIF